MKKAVIETFNANSDTEEDIPKKFDVHTARQDILLGPHPRTLFNELEVMAGNSKEAKKLGHKIWKAYGANSGDNLGNESATTMGKATSRLSGGKGCYILII